MTRSLSEVLDEFDEARVSARKEGEWMDRGDLRGSFSTEKHFVKGETDTETRYVFSAEDGEVTEWKRYSMPVEGIKADVEIVVEVRGNQSFEVSDKIAVGGNVFEREPVGVNHVAGLEDEKEKILDFLHGFDKDFGLREQTGLILEGPPGTGKTELVREVCKERYGSVPVTVSGPEILSKWVGESERALRQKFDEAREKSGVLYIDELDAIGRARTESDGSYATQVVAQLLVLLDGVEAKRMSEEGEELKVIASTNEPDAVDPALKRPGRLGNLPVEFEKPGEYEKKAILHHYLEKVRRSEDGTLDSDLEALVTDGDTDGLEHNIIDKLNDSVETGAEIEDWVVESVKLLRKQGEMTLESKTLVEAIQRMDVKGD